MRHVLVQPSPLALLPSSHSSMLSFLPSPQLGTHFCPGMGHFQPLSMRQLEQPSKLAVLPSSHCSVSSTLPSPHLTSLVHLPPVGGQLQNDASIPHTEEH